MVFYNFCPKCNKDFSDKRLYQQHINRKIPCDYRVCNGCKYKFASRSSLLYHINNSLCRSLDSKMVELKNNTIPTETVRKPSCVQKSNKQNHFQKSRKNLNVTGATRLVPIYISKYLLM